MPEYQVLARKYRPQTFAEVLGQDAIVTTLKNAIRHNRLAHAYLFCGSRGTGKTTLFRIFAKALNCQNPSPDHEPCNRCASCKEITSGTSLDILEIDGASHRGIDDIRQINDTVGYTAASGKYKVYIIDEVHMLTKEAFNALLKTLEEPPPKVKFFFATTEPHKVLPTILSRCQRFNLNRIPIDLILGKLHRIANEMGFKVEEEALRLVASRAEGGLRDAESLLDQILSYHDGDTVTAASAAEILGVMPKETLFELDTAGKEGRLAAAFEIAHRLFAEGKDFAHFLEMLAEHFRNILAVKLAGSDTPALTLAETERAQYAETAKMYRQEQCLSLLDMLVAAQRDIRGAPNVRIAIEAILLQILRSHSRVPIDIVVRRLGALEKALAGNAPEPMPAAAYEPVKSEPAPPKKTPQPMQRAAAPAAAEVKRAPPPEKREKPTPPATPPLPPEEAHRYDTLLQFAAVELEGKLQKH